jgi:hypothetical protein
MSNPQVSAINCTHNHSRYLGAAIDSLLTQDFTKEFEIIIVNKPSKIGCEQGRVGVMLPVQIQRRIAVTYQAIGLVKSWKPVSFILASSL